MNFLSSSQVRHTSSHIPLLHICNYGCSSASQKHLQIAGQRLERISNASRTHAEGNGEVNN